MSMTIKEVADQLIFDLKNAGFQILRYDAYSTDSVYLKLDYGVSGSIRISDHKGYDRLKYTFNVGIKIRKSYQKEGRNFYSIDDLDALVDDCITYRDNRLLLFGTPTYNHYMELNKERGRQQLGFWQKAKRV